MRLFNWKRRSLILVLVLLINLLLVVPVSFAVEKVVVQSPPVISALPLFWMEEEGKLADEVELDIHLSPDHSRAIALISGGEIDMMVTGVNVGAKVYNKGIDVALMNANIWATDYLLTNGFKAESWEDLKGKTLGLPLKGGPLDFLARYFLLKNGIRPEEVDLVYRPLKNGAQYFQAGKLDSIILPEPLVTVTLAKTDEANISLKIHQEWAEFHEGESRIPFVGLFVSGDFARNNPELAEKINKYYQEGIDWVNDNPEAAASLAARHFNMPAKLLKSSFERINFNHYPFDESFKLIEGYFNEILEFYPEMIGGRLPDEGFYQESF